MLFAASMWQWIGVGIGAILLSILAICIAVNIRQQRRVPAFFRELERASFLIGSVETLWNALLPWQQIIVKANFCEKMMAANLSPEALMRAKHSMRLFLKQDYDLFLNKNQERQAMRHCVLSHLRDPNVSKLAIEYWSPLPDDLLTELIVADPQRMTTSYYSDDVKETSKETRTKIVEKLDPVRDKEYIALLQSLPEPAAQETK